MPVLKRQDSEGTFLIFLCIAIVLAVVLGMVANARGQTQPPGLNTNDLKQMLGERDISIEWLQRQVNDQRLQIETQNRVIAECKKEEPK